MSKKILVICGSPHKNSHSDALANSFAKGARESGNTTEVIKLTDKKLAPCIGCDACRKSGNWECIQKDDMQELYKHAQEADVKLLHIVFLNAFPKTICRSFINTPKKRM